MATQVTTFFSTPVVKEYLGAKTPDQDKRIEQIADGVCRRIEMMTGRKFVTRSVTLLTDARGKTLLQLPDYPITTITSVKRRADLLDAWETFDAADYAADTRLGVLHLAADTFYAGPLTCEVVYTAGFGAKDDPTLPLFQEALDYCKFVFTRQGNGMLVVSSATQGGQSAVVVPEPPKDIRDAILTYRKVRL